MSDLILYSNKMSRGRIIHWMLEELGVHYRVEWLDFGPSMKAESFKAINPMGKVPALKHGDVVVTETAAILTYLADIFAEKALIPASDSPKRAAFYRWMFFIAGPLEAATTNAFFKLALPDTTPLGTPTAGFLGYGGLSLCLDTIEQHLIASEYVCGKNFSAADIYLASHLDFGIGYVKAYPTRPVFDDYIQRTMRRPAKQRADTV